MELESLENLERQVERLLERFAGVKRDKEELTQRVSQLEAENARLRESNAKLQSDLTEAQRNARDPEKEMRIRAKVDELLSKLEGF